MSGMSKNTTKFDLSNAITLTQAAELAGVTDRWMRQLVKDEKVRAVRIGKFWLVDKDDAEKFQRHPTAGRPRKK